MSTKKFLYNNYVQVLSNRVVGELEKITANFNFELGVEFEIAMCLVLKNILPRRFGVCRGFVVDAAGDTAGDDIIIFDKSRYPTLASRSELEFLRKEYVPVEAVYAYIEAKHTLKFGAKEKSNIEKAADQVAAVRRLCKGRFSGRCISRFQNDEFGKIGDKDRIYAMVVARFVSGSNGEILEPPQVAQELENCRIEFPGPDCIIAGNSLVTYPGYYTEEYGQTRCQFMLSPDYWCQPIHVENVAFGCGIILMMAAIEKIELGPMPWNKIVSNAVWGASVVGATLANDVDMDMRPHLRPIAQSGDYERYLSAKYDTLLKRFDAQTVVSYLQHEGFSRFPEVEACLQNENIEQAINLVKELSIQEYNK